MSNTPDSRPACAANNPTNRTALALCTRQRAVLFVCALAVTVCALLMSRSQPRNPDEPALPGLSAVFLWLVVFRLDYQRRGMVRALAAGEAKVDQAPS